MFGMSLLAERHVWDVAISRKTCLGCRYCEYVNQSVNKYYYYYYLSVQTFYSKKINRQKLPPTLDALENACTPVLNLPSPVNNGWVENEGHLEIEFMVLRGIPENIVELLHCKCKKGFKTNDCIYRKSTHVCSSGCSCNEKEECYNTEQFVEDSDDGNETDT